MNSCLKFTMKIKGITFRLNILKFDEQFSQESADEEEDDAGSLLVLMFILLSFLFSYFFFWGIIKISKLR